MFRIFRFGGHPLTSDDKKLNNNVTAASSDPNSDPLERRREVCLFQCKGWTKSIAWLDIATTLLFAALILLPTLSSPRGCGLHWGQVYGRAWTSLDDMNATDMAFEDVNATDLATEGMQLKTEMTTEGTETANVSTQIKHKSVLTTNGTHAAALTMDMEHRDVALRFKVVGFGVCFSLAVNTLLFIGNAKERTGFFWPWILLEWITFLGAAMSLFWAQWETMQAHVIVVAIYSAKKLFCLYAVHQRLQEIKEAHMRKSRASFCNPLYTTIESDL